MENDHVKVTYGLFSPSSLSFSEKHGVIARNDYWNTSLECSSCSILFNNEFNLKKHRKYCSFVKSGFTMFSTKKQASCAINEDVWNTTPGSDLSHQKFKHSTLWITANFLNSVTNSPSTVCKLSVEKNVNSKNDSRYKEL
ncbi:unnamed protein product [Onchocerca flexuosa]|uniref:C2H2-type domain-containing protein n=1 Tax=Onchocerca flexuosa TaxID=387005 RepID=A0A183HTH9_9BILA|nr:unnamed protein product [Onchocerca flexuosa]